nr:retrovirus-related Pol polyprotein from transposon TNT 1-94 [Tanacetum cinerariifolium]
MNYLEEQMDREAMINPIKNEKKIQKIDRLARSLLIQGLPNDIYSLIDNNKTAKDLWDALARHMLGSEYGEQDRKVVVLYEYETFKATERELLFDTYIRYLQVINDLTKCVYSKDNCELNFKFLNNLQPEWKQYAPMMRQNNNLMDINIDALYNILKQNQGDVNDAMKSKKKAVVITSDPLELIIALLDKAFNRKKFYSNPTNNNLRTSSATSSANKKQEYVKSDDKKEEKRVDEKKKDMSKKDKDEQVPLVEDHAWMESSSDSDQEINANMVFMAQIKKFLSDSEASSSSSDDKIAEQTSSLKPYFSTVILEKIIIDLEDEVVSLLDKEKENLKIIESLKSKGFESSENAISESENQSKNDCHVVEKGCDQVENSNVIAPGIFKLSVSQSVSSIYVTKMYCASNSVESKLKRNRRKRTSSKQHGKQVNKDVLRAAKDFVNFLDLDTLSSVRRPKSSGVMWMKKGSSNTVKADLSSVNHSNLNKNVKNAYCNSYDADVNDLFVFDDMKFKKVHLCSACEQGKIHRKHHKFKTAFASNKPLYLLHMDFCGPMRVESINEKRYVLVVIDYYSRYTWVFFLHSKDEASEVIISFIKKTQVNLQLQVQRVRTDNGMEFKNKTLAKFFDEVGVAQQFSIARTPQQNGVVERRNRTLVKAARTMLTFANLSLFLWAEAIATSCFTQNRSIIHKRFDKTPYELTNKRKPNTKFFYVFGCICYLLNDYVDVGKLKAKGDIRVFVGYSKKICCIQNLQQMNS